MAATAIAFKRISVPRDYSCVSFNIYSRAKFHVTSSLKFERNIKEGIGNAVPVPLSSNTYGPKSNNTPLLIMHGLMGSKQNWNSIAKEISRKTSREVRSVDLRNHGESPHTQEMTYNHMASDVKEFIEKESLGPVVLIGHSMGGRVAMHLALSEASMVERLVVVDISPLGSSPSLHSMVRYFYALRSVHIEKGISMSAARKTVDLQLAANIPDPAVRQFLITNLISSDDGNYKWRVNLDVLEKYFSSDIAQFPNSVHHAPFTKPALFIAGAESDYLRKVDEPGIQKLFPEAKFEYIHGAGHWVHAEKPAKFMECLFSFLLM